MQDLIIYTAIERCPHCKKDITTNLRSSDPDFLDKAPGLKKEVSEYGMNRHWYLAHRVCAKCGKLIHSGEGGWALADKIDWPINETYIEWTHKSGLQVLDVHKACATN